MTTAREVYAYCDVCLDTKKHLVDDADMGSCTCDTCGKTQVLMVPIN